MNALPVYHSISSPSNPLLKEVRKAIAKGTLTADGECVAESFHLLNEALSSRVHVSTVLAAESARARVEDSLRERTGIRVALLPDRVFESVAGTNTSQGVIALVMPRLWRIDQLFTGPALVVVLDGVQDPGNAGTMVRAAEAFGATGVLFVKGSANPHHPKTLRAAAGSLFRVPYISAVEPSIARAALVRNCTFIYAAQPGEHAQTVDGVDFRSPCAIVIGSEGTGIGPEFRSSSIAVNIPTRHVESLNASTAGAIFLYEAYRQRRQS